MEQNRNRRDKSTHLWPPYYDKGGNIYIYTYIYMYIYMIETVSSTSGTGKTGQLCVKE